MDLRRLNHLVALAEARNFGRAARQCHLSQPAFSRSIQAAEEELGLTLFDRGAREVTCTHAGAFVVERARKLVFESNCLERDVGLYRDRVIGDVAFGVGPYPAATMVPPLLVELRSRFPKINTRVEVNNAEFLADHLRAEELDFFLADVRNVQSTPEFSIRKLARMTAGFYVRRGHPLLKSPRHKGADLLPYGLASVRIPEPVRKILGQFMGLKSGVRLPLAIECDDLSVLKNVAMTTDTVLGCPDAGARKEVGERRLVQLKVGDQPPLFADMGVVSLKGRSFSLMAQFAVDFLAKVCAQQEHAGQ